MHFRKEDCEFFSQIFKKLQNFAKIFLLHYLRRFSETVKKIDHMHSMLKKHRWG